MSAPGSRRGNCEDRNGRKIHFETFGDICLVCRDESETFLVNKFFQRCCIPERFVGHYRVVTTRVCTSRSMSGGSPKAALLFQGAPPHKVQKRPWRRFFTVARTSSLDSVCLPDCWLPDWVSAA